MQASESHYFHLNFIVFGKLLIREFLLLQGKSTNERELAREYQILNDILTYYAYLFDVSITSIVKNTSVNFYLWNTG